MLMYATLKSHSHSFAKKEMNKSSHQMMSRADQIRVYINYALLISKTYPHLFLSFKKMYRNYFSVAYHMKKNDYPITAKLRNGTERLYHRPEEIRFDTAHISYLNTDIVTIDDMKFIGGISNGDLLAIFVEKEYDILSVKDKIVVDIGANIGDSSIYFVKRGARKVYAIEPNQELYQLAKKNISLNSMSDTSRDSSYFAACSSKTSTYSSPPFLSLRRTNYFL